MNKSKSNHIDQYILNHVLICKRVILIFNSNKNKIKNFKIVYNKFL